MQSTGYGLQNLKHSLDSLENIILDRRLDLDYLLAEQRGVCAVINNCCCTYRNTIGQVEENIKEIYNQAKWLYEFAKGSPMTDSI